MTTSEKPDTTKARQLCDKLTTKLNQAKDLAMQIAEVMGEFENIGPRIGAYLVGNLENLLDNPHQCGSVPDILDSIEACENEDGENN